ncbi:hypothetical protein [Telluria beijingensis]|uniref:hypothetical protein n=1 Tax=Telluria beijingensis TaxID=3068633 RepID=UPI0027962EAD|nr:hypothetical protein [Massilia sp. REN29]
MQTIKLDLEHGSVFVDSLPIKVDEDGILAGSILGLCSPPIDTDTGSTQYRLLRKVSIFGKPASVVIEIGAGRVCAIAFLFDLIEFFESSVLESKILKACEKSLNASFISNHPSTAFLDIYEWGKLTFFYDAKQGDLSLDITFHKTQRNPIST